MSYEGAGERAARQKARAQQVAFELAGARCTHGLMRVMLALVESVERPEAASAADAGPGAAAGAREVLRPKQSTGRAQ